MTAIMDRWRNVVSHGICKDGSDAGQSQYLGMFRDVSGENGVLRLLGSQPTFIQFLHLSSKIAILKSSMQRLHQGQMKKDLNL